MLFARICNTMELSCVELSMITGTHKEITSSLLASTSWIPFQQCTLLAQSHWKAHIILSCCTWLSSWAWCLFWAVNCSEQNMMTSFCTFNVSNFLSWVGKYIKVPSNFCCNPSLSESGWGKQVVRNNSLFWYFWSTAFSQTISAWFATHTSSRLPTTLSDWGDKASWAIPG